MPASSRTRVSESGVDTRVEVMIMRDFADKAKQDGDSVREEKYQILKANGQWQNHNWRPKMRKQPCQYCDSRDRVTIDHLVPISCGGINHPSNAVPACFNCNQYKQNRSLVVWLVELWKRGDSRAAKVEAMLTDDELLEAVKTRMPTPRTLPGFACWPGL